MTTNTDTNELPAAEDWKALHLPGDPDNLELMVDAVLELVISAQLLHCDFDGDLMEGARSIWNEDLPRVSQILGYSDFIVPCYPLEMVCLRALHSFLGTPSRQWWYENRAAHLREEIRLGIRWSLNDIKGVRTLT